jgi:hypothetical protein
VVRFCSPAEAIAFDRFHHLFVPVATRNVSRDPSLQRVGEVQNLEGVSPEEQSLRAARGSGRRGVLTLGHISGRDVARPPSSPTDILRVGGWRRPSQAREPLGIGPHAIERHAIRCRIVLLRTRARRATIQQADRSIAKGLKVAARRGTFAARSGRVGRRST